MELKLNELTRLLENVIRDSVNHQPYKDMSHEVLVGYLEGMQQSIQIISEAELTLVEYKQLQEKLQEVPVSIHDNSIPFKEK